MAGKPHIRRDLTGQRFGLLVVLGPGKYVYRERPGKQAFTCRFWRCQCDCGKETEVALGNLTSKLTISCGCQGSRASIGMRRRTHGLSADRPREYNIWRAMIHRCHNVTDPGYKNYGGRGIAVCDRWRESCAAFIEDMGLSPDGMTIDRIDNEQGYFPENCRWTTVTENNRNMRRTLLVTFKGRTQALAAWAEEVGISYSTLKSRLENGWSAQRMLSTSIIPVDMRRVVYLRFQGRMQPLREWAKELGMKPVTLAARLKSGWSVERALSTPVLVQMRR